MTVLDPRPAPSLVALVQPRRSATDRRIAGVAAGWAEMLGVSAVIVRAGLCALTAAGGIGFVIYLAAWAAVLDQDKVVTVPARPANRQEKLGLVALFIGLLLVMRSFGIWFGATAVPCDAPLRKYSI